jgi:hypothetical protein
MFCEKNIFSAFLRQVRAALSGILDLPSPSPLTKEVILIFRISFVFVARESCGSLFLLLRPSWPSS